MTTNINKIEHGASNSKYNVFNIEPNDTSCVDPHAVGIMETGNPVLPLPAVYGPFGRLVPTALTTSRLHSWTALVELSEPVWDAALPINLEPSLISPYKSVVTATITANRTYILPTAVDLVAFLGDSFKGGSYWEIRWGANGADLTLDLNVGVALRGNNAPIVIFDGTHRTMGFRLVNLEPGAESYEIWYL